jgi:SAM-dependent methyltransferase
MRILEARLRGGREQQLSERFVSCTAPATSCQEEEPMSDQGSLRLQYDDWHRGVVASDDDDNDVRAPWVELAKSHLTQHVPGRSVLEIGCGRGALASYIMKLEPAELIAADFSPAGVDLTKERLSPYANARAMVVDIQEMPFEAHKFDVVVSFETIEHVPFPQRAVCEIARVLKPGGWVILTTPNYLGLTGLYRGYKRLSGDPFKEVGQPLNRFTMLPLTRYWFRSSGLQVENWTSRGHYLPWPGRPALRLNLPAYRWLDLFGLHSIVVARKPESI